MLSVQYLSYCYDLELRFSKLSKAFAIPDHDEGISLAIFVTTSSYQSFLAVVQQVYIQLIKSPSMTNNVYFYNFIEMDESYSKVASQ